MEEELEGLASFFAKAELPTSIWLNESAEITDVPKFIESHIETVKHGIGKKSAIPYLERLGILKQIIENL